MEILKDKTLLSELTKGLEPGSSYCVNITHVNNPHSFYVRPTKYDALLESLENQPPSSSEYDTHDFITFNLDTYASTTRSAARYIRGQIIATNRQNDDVTYDIIAVDYGYLKKGIPLNHISKCSEVVGDIPALAIHCQLANCKPVGGMDWSKESIESFKFYIGDESVMIKVVERISGKLNVNITNTYPNDIAAQLAITGSVIFIYNQETKQKFGSIVTTKMFLNFKNVKENDTLHVRMQYGSSLKEFYVAEIEDFKNYLENKVKISNAVDSKKELSDDELTENRLVCVLDNLGQYEKALIKSYAKSESEATVQLLDSGEELTTNISNVKSVPDCCFSCLAIAIYCSVEDHQLHDSSLLDILKPGCEFSITIREVGRRFKTPNIVSITLIEKENSKNAKKENIEKINLEKEYIEQHNIEKEDITKENIEKT